MLAVLLSPIYILVNIYLVIRALRWLKQCNGVFAKKGFKIAFITVYIIFATSLLTAFFLPASGFQRIVKRVSNQWLGVFLYMVLSVALADLVKLGLRLMKKYPKRDDGDPKYRKYTIILGSIVSVCILAMSVYGIVNARYIRINDYNLEVNKEAGDLEELNVVLIADLHLGYNIGCDMMEQMVEKVNAQNADLVVIAGDIYDNQYAALEDPERLATILSGIQSKYGVYACYGNHDIEEPILAGFTFGNADKVTDPRLDEFIQASNIQILRDEAVLIDDSFYLVGRRDRERPGNEEAQRLTPDELTSTLDKTKPILVIDHEPAELQELADAGVDADLCGHTHDGQVFPGNVLTSLMWENSCGYLKKDDMHNVVTSGVGVFGPFMRTFTDSEICNINIHFQ